MYSDTEKLLALLMEYADDCLAALWDVCSPYYLKNEDAEQTVKNLGAYIKHVHMKDSVLQNGERRFCLIGEGDLPIGDIMNALSCINYDGYISLDWNPKWMLEMTDMEVVFAHFASFMEQFQTERESSFGKKIC